MKKHRILFLMSCIFCLISPFPIQPFSPYLVFLYKKRGWIAALWISTCCGLIVDLVSHSPFGLHALHMMLVTLIAYRARIYFIDKLVGLVSYSVLIAIMLSCLSRCSLTFYNPTFPLTWKGIGTDFFFILIGDGIYAFFFVAAPFWANGVQNIPCIAPFLKKNLIKIDTYFLKGFNHV